MKRCVIASRYPWIWIDKFSDHSIMVINPDAPGSRYNYLLEHSDYSLLITDEGVTERNGGNYPNEKVFWYTSGTTGDSKFYGFTNEQVDRMTRTICEAYDLTANDRYYGIMPLWHAHGQGFYWATQRAGCDVRFGSIKDKSEIELFQPTFVTSIPDMMPVIMRWDLQYLRFVRTASSAMPQRLFKELQQRFHVPVIEAFGMTEALSHCFTNPLHGEQRIGTVGLPDGIQVQLRNQHLWIQGPCTVNADWVDTGDLAERDDRGYYRILGRHQDQINVKGIKINPASIEQKIIERFPQIEEVAVFGVDQLKCIVKGNINMGDLRKFLVDLGTHCRPSVLYQVDTIPRTPQGKISRRFLESQF
jgi:acyl-coenzyme A synthetase/AMP-(fatty) acid ligase